MNNITTHNAIEMNIGNGQLATVAHSEYDFIDYEQMSNCCNAPALGEVSAMGVGFKMFGSCSKCGKMSSFYRVED